MNLQSLIPFASDKKKKKQLHDAVHKLVKLKKPIPVLNAKTPQSFVTQYNKALKANKDDFKTLFDIVPKGVGPGEVLLACLQEDLTIGGGSATYDVNLGSHEVEVKGVNVSADKVASNFRLGVESKPAINKALAEIKRLYDVVKMYVPEINTPQWETQVAKGEMTKLRHYLSAFDIKQAEGFEKLGVTVHKNLDVMFGPKKVGSLKDKDIIKQLTTMAQTKYTKIVTYDEIEKQLEKDLAAHKMKYFFFNMKTQELYYKPKLSDTFIESITGNIIKVKCRLK